MLSAERRVEKWDRIRFSLSIRRDENVQAEPGMSKSFYQHLAVLLGVVCFGLMVLCGWLFWKHGWLTIRVAFASEQTQIFEDMRTKALQNDSGTAADCLRYVVWYYPSGSKQEAGSRLDRMVERE